MVLCLNSTPSSRLLKSVVFGSVERSRDEARETELKAAKRLEQNIPLYSNVTIQDNAVKMMLKLQLIFSTPNINISFPC